MAVDSLSHALIIVATSAKSVDRLFEFADVFRREAGCGYSADPVSQAFPADSDALGPLAFWYHSGLFQRVPTEPES